MFLCKRQIDINARFGLPRIAFMSAVATIIMFLVSYEVMYFYLIRHYQIDIFSSFYYLYLWRIHYIKVYIYYFSYHIENRLKFISWLKENGLYSIIPTSINLYTNFIFALT